MSDEAWHEMIDGRDKEIERLRIALTSIADMHCGDQPASSGHSEEIWLRLHIGKMRAAAFAALK